MRSAQIVYKKEPAGILTQKDDGSFLFSYYPEWIQNDEKPPVSLTLPKAANPFRSPYLFAWEREKKLFTILPNPVEPTDQLTITQTATETALLRFSNLFRLLIQIVDFLADRWAGRSIVHPGSLGYALVLFRNYFGEAGKFASPGSAHFFSYI